LAVLTDHLSYRLDRDFTSFKTTEGVNG
jgi:hypothetical protein